MFLNLFFGLKEAKVPVSLREHLTLIEAMQAGLVIYDVEEFYFLARSALVKDERHLDRFDRVFAEVFKGLETVSGTPEGVEEMITYFQVNGVMCYVDPWGEVLGYEDVFTKIELCKKHFAEVGLGEDFVDQFIR